MKRETKQTRKKPEAQRPKRRLISAMIIGSVTAAIGIVAVLRWFPVSPRVRSQTPVSQPTTRESKRPTTLQDKENNVFLITIDTLRADHLGCYGDKEIQTPSLDKIAKEGVKFQDVTTPVPLTLPSHASILTGTYPLDHGIKDNAGYFLDTSSTTLAEVLRQNGFRTGASVGAFVLDRKWGLNQGFESYDDRMDPPAEGKVNLDVAERKGGKVLQAALKWLDQHKQEQLFFWLHLYDPHTPYEAPEPFRSLYSDRPYDGEIAYTDQVMSRLISWLTDNNLLEKSLIVVIGDHGEGLGEHGESTHGYFIYDSTLRIPLLMRFPQQRFHGREIQRPVQSIDVMPTILQWLGLPIPDRVQGTSLLPCIMEERELPDLASYSESYYAREHFGWSELRCLRTDRYKYIKAPEPELYDLQRDPQELQNLFSQESDVARKLDERLKDLVNKYERREQVSPKKKLSPEDEEKLKSLGYLGSTTKPEAKPEGGLPDPKSKLHLYNRLLQAEGLIKDGNFSQATDLLEQLVSSDPKIIDGYFLIGRLAFETKDYKKAIMWNQRLLSVRPDHVLAVFNIALSYRRLNRLDNALAGFRRVLELDPRNQKALFNIADTYLEVGDLERAAEFCNKALQTDERQADIYVILASVYYGRQEFTKAEEALKTALALSSADQPIPSLHFNLALLHERKGNVPEAMKEYEKELELFPESYKSLANLGILYEQLDMPDKQIDAFARLIKIDPDNFYGYFLLAQALLIHRHETEEAKKLTMQSLKLNPDFSASHYLLSAIYQKEGNEGKAKEEFELAQKIEKKHSQ